MRALIRTLPFFQNGAGGGGGRPTFASRAIAAAAYLGRNQGPELFFTDPFASNTQSVIPKVLSINRSLESVWLLWRGRIVIAGANYTAVASEAPQNILQRIRITGTYKGSQLTPIDLTGATAFAWPALFGRGGSSLIINGTRQADPGTPFQQVGATFGNIGTFDVEILYRIPMWPVVLPVARAVNALRYCWQPQDWNDTLQIQINYGDGALPIAAGAGGTSFGTPAALTTVVLTAFGSGAGTPQVSIFTSYLVAGPLRSGFRSAAVVRNEQSITQSMATVANRIRVATLQKRITAGIVLKTGTTLTGSAAGVNVYGNLLDTMLDETQVVVDNRPWRNNQNDRVFREFAAMQYNGIPVEGYLVIPFDDSQTPRAALRADLPSVVSSGAQFELIANVATANAQNQANLIQEQIWADPDDPYWAHTR